MSDALQWDFERIEAAAAELEICPVPSALRLRVLAEVERTPQDKPRPVPANSPWRWGVPMVAAAAVFFLAVRWVAPEPPIGDPSQMVARGVDGVVLPAIDLRIAVRGSDGGVDRLHRGEAYRAGSTLLFRYDAASQVWLHLIRVDGAGAKLLHAARVPEGAGDIMTSDGRLGYELEHGEDRAVFALIAHSEDLSELDVGARLAVGVHPASVCAAARELGARCAAEMVEAVR